MAFPHRKFPHILSLALAAGCAMVPVGCGGGDGVTKYTVPRTTERERQDIGEPPAGGEYRMLGGMFPADDPVWFFKYSGPAEVVAKHEADFDKLLASVKLNGPTGLDFTPPEGWVRGPGRDTGFVKVFATVKTTDGKQEVSITQSAGGVEPNLMRWVGQIGLRPGADDVAKYTKTIEANGVKGLKVDLKGPKNPTTKGGKGMPAGHP